eukprot:TRINITY_DN436_c0_g1_i2.p3 TRINITY_DN436_c0_g1~~TRINITY_DN436_c0_g1_i2.p3  ORF type:complete len:311 (+),score=75.03 TRINITY_DN436_c0_g1_i2:81-1013(+)
MLAPLVVFHWADVPTVNVVYEVFWLLAFLASCGFAWRRGELRRFFGGMAYGTITEFTVYVGLELAKFQGVGRQYDHGIFTMMIFDISPLYMDLFWPVAIYLSEVCARTVYGTKTLFSRLVVGCALAVIADFAIEPIAINIAWFGIEGGYLLGTYVADKVTKPQWVWVVPAFIVQVLVSLFGMTAWCTLMTAFRWPYGLVRCLSDSTELVFLVVVSTFFTVLYAARRKPAVGDETSRWVLLFPAGLCACWQAYSLCLRFHGCNPVFQELCTADGLFAVVFSAACAVLLFVLPVLLQGNQAANRHIKRTDRI